MTRGKSPWRDVRVTRKRLEALIHDECIEGLGARAILLST